MNQNNLSPLQFAVYKGKTGKWGSVQFDFGQPHFYNSSTKQRDYTGDTAKESPAGRKLKDGWKEKEGCIFMSITSATAPDVYDWDHQIKMALGLPDLGALLLTLLTGDECKIIHDPNANTEKADTVKKNIYVSSPKGVKTGVIFNVSQKSSNEELKHSVPLNGSEVVILKNLLEVAISKALAW